MVLKMSKFLLSICVRLVSNMTAIRIPSQKKYESPNVKGDADALDSFVILGVFDPSTSFLAQPLTHDQHTTILINDNDEDPYPNPCGCAWNL